MHQQSLQKVHKESRIKPTSHRIGSPPWEVYKLAEPGSMLYIFTNVLISWLSLESTQPYFLEVKIFGVELINLFPAVQFAEELELEASPIRQQNFLQSVLQQRLCIIFTAHHFLNNQQASSFLEQEDICTYGRSPLKINASHFLYLQKTRQRSFPLSLRQVLCLWCMQVPLSGEGLLPPTPFPFPGDRWLPIWANSGSERRWYTRSFNVVFNGFDACTSDLVV